MFSAFNPSKWSSGQPTLRCPGSSWGFGALPKGLTSVMDTYCQSRDSNPQPWVTSGFKSNALSIRPRLPHINLKNVLITIFLYFVVSLIILYFIIVLLIQFKVYLTQYSVTHSVTTIGACCHIWA